MPVTMDTVYFYKFNNYYNRIIKRYDTIAEYTTNYEIIKEYAPAQMGEEEIKALLMEKYADVIATNNKGMIMKTVMAELKGKADGKVINAVVAELCK